MLHILSCITQEHDLRFVVLAGLICLFGCFTAFSLIARARGAPSPIGRWAWVGAAAVVTGSGVWTTHFVAMLAYRPGLALGYELGLTALSVALAIALTGAGYTLALSRPRWAAAGGALAGAAIGAMHYVGMAAMRVAAHVHYDAATVGVSVAIGVLLGAYAFRLEQRRRDLKGALYPALAFTLAICAMHFTGMSAVTLVPDPTIPMPQEIAAPAGLAVAVSAVTLLMIALSLAGSIMDLHLADRRTAEGQRLRRHVVALEATQRELEATAANLSLALDQAAASNRAKSQFLAAMSHELRTPLNAVIGFADMLSGEFYGPLGDQRYRDYAASISSGGTRLLNTINDVLDFANIDADRLVLEEEEIDTAELIERVLGTVAAAAAEAGLELRRDWSAPPPHLFGDQRRIRQVLINLLSNAIKFTPRSGSVTLRVRRCGGGLAIGVADSGIGIAADQIAGAFQPFHQIDNRLERAFEGSGLGLPLCKRLMELHGGGLTLESEPGRGTVATAVFPGERVIGSDPTPAVSGGSADQAFGDPHGIEHGALQKLVAGDEHRRRAGGRVAAVLAEAAD